MKELALRLPWSDTNDPSLLIQNTPGFNSGGQFPDQTLGGAISALSTIALYIGGFMMLIWLVWGAFQYMIAEGNKESLAKARARMRWAIIGFIILLMAFFISEALQQYVAPMILPGGIKELTPPK